MNKKILTIKIIFWLFYESIVFLLISLFDFNFWNTLFISLLITLSIYLIIHLLDFLIIQFNNYQKNKRGIQE